MLLEKEREQALIHYIPPGHCMGNRTRTVVFLFFSLRFFFFVRIDKSPASEAAQAPAVDGLMMGRFGRSVPSLY